MKAGLYVQGHSDCFEDMPFEIFIIFGDIRHLHVYIFQSEEWKNQLRFRNYLRKHSVERQAYETLKKTWRGVFHITGLLYKRKRIGSSQP
ncbi:hypothetical protein DT075_12640 [Bacillus licheniformis]|nr:hypothetical protein DT075_12640 [Bacillus licheniformis]